MAVLRGEPDRFFHLRLGMDELRVFVASLIVGIAIYFVLVVAMLVTMMAVAGLAASIGVAVMAPAIIAMALSLGLMIWLYVRLSLAAPLTLMRRKIIIGDSWRVTRGHFWALFGAYLILFLVVLAIALAASAVTTGSFWMDLVRGGLNSQGAAQAAQAQLARQSSPIGPMIILGWIFGAFSGSLMIAIAGGAVATAASELVVDADRIADTFA